MKDIKQTCVIAGSFDPFTNGHLELVKKAEELYEKVIIVVADNEAKKYMFGKKERMKIISLYVDNEVVDLGDETLGDETLGDYARDNNYDIVKGVRNETDKYYEDQLAMFNRDNYGVYTHYIKTTGEVSLISSSFVKLAYKHNIDIGKYVHQYVQKRFNEENNLTIIGVTGGIASGKSTFIKALYQYHTIISMDDLAKTIYDRKTPKHIELTDKIIENLCNFGFITTPETLKTVLRKSIFGNTTLLVMVDSILGAEIKRLLMRELTTLNNSRGSHHIVIECASFDKYPYLIDVCNHDVTFLAQDDEVRAKYLMERDGINLMEAYTTIETLGFDESKINAISDYHDESLGRFRVINVNINKDHCKKMFHYYSDFGLHNFISERSYIDLIIQYSNSNRHYHNLSHIISMIDEYNVEDVYYPQSMVMSILYHDYYQKVDNAEDKSALKLEEDLFRSPVIHGVSTDLIRHTANHRTRTELNKLDLAILTSDEETYNEYKVNIRKEYKEFNDKDYAFGRMEVLNKLLMSPYVNDPTNINKEIEELLEVVNGI